MSKRANQLAFAVFWLVGVVTVFVVDDATAGRILFLGVSAVFAWIFSLVYMVWASWYSTPPARAILYLLLAYAAATTGQWVFLQFGWTYEWEDDVVQLLYLNLTAAILNMALTLTRMVREEGRSPLGATVRGRRTGRQ